MRVKKRFIFFALAVWVCVQADARACGCIVSFEQYQPCGAYWKASVVFVGVVSEQGPHLPVEGSGGKAFTANGRTTRFTVEEAFRGVSGETIETTEHGTSCDYHFEVGKRYFVYGSRDPKDGKVYVGSCSATTTLDRAAAHITYARGVAQGEQTPSIIGYVSRETRTSAASYRSQSPLEGIRVLAEGMGQTTETKTEADGSFKFYGLPAGRYRVSALTPKELRVPYGKEVAEVEVVDGRCRGAGFLVTSLSTINGKVVDSEGIAAKAKVSLVLVDEKNKEIPQAEGSVETYTERDGRYKFNFVAPGRYLLAINPHSQPGSTDPPYPRTYYPGVRTLAEAIVITITEGEHFEAEDFRLPKPLKPCTIEGVALKVDGRPAVGASVKLEFTERKWFEVEGTDEQGRFKLKAFEGFKYLVVAELRGNNQASHSAPLEVTACLNPEPLRLVITKPGYYRPRYSK